jgi:hypothetical protein
LGFPKPSNIRKKNKEPSIKIMPGDTERPKYFCNGEEWYIEYLRIIWRNQKNEVRKMRGKSIYIKSAKIQKKNQLRIKVSKSRI